MSPGLLGRSIVKGSSWPRNATVRGGWAAQNFIPGFCHMRLLNIADSTRGRTGDQGMVLQNNYQSIRLTLKNDKDLKVSLQGCQLKEANLLFKLCRKTKV